MPAERFPCPCCGQLTLSEPEAYDICGACGWEDDPLGRSQPWSGGGANGPESLWEAQLRVGRKLTRRQRAEAFEAMVAAEADRRRPEHLAALSRALGVAVEAESMVDRTEALRLSLAVWNGPVPNETHRQCVPDERAVDALLARVARSTPRDLDVIVLSIALDDLIGAPRVPALRVLERWREVMEVTQYLNVCTTSLRTGLAVSSQAGGFEVIRWGQLAAG